MINMFDANAVCINGDISPFTDTYTITVDGGVLMETCSASLIQFIPGFSAGLEEIVLEPGQTGSLQILQDGKGLSCRSADGSSANLMLNWEELENSRSIRVVMVRLMKPSRLKTN